MDSIKGGPHKNLFQFINLLKDQQEKFENKIFLLDGGAPPKKPEPKYKLLNKTIENLTNDYDNNLLSNLDFLDAISGVLSL